MKQIMHERHESMILDSRRRRRGRRIRNVDGNGELIQESVLFISVFHRTDGRTVSFPCKIVTGDRFASTELLVTDWFEIYYMRLHF